MRTASCFILCLFFMYASIVCGEDLYTTDTFHQHEEKQYTVEKTLDIAKRISASEWWRELGRPPDFSIKLPLNPDARPEMYRILNDPNQKKYWNSMVKYLGLLGQDEDVDKFSEIIKRYRTKQLDDSEEYLFLCIVYSISGMEDRGVPKARAMIDAMMEPQYWDSLGILTPNGKRAALTFGISAIKSKSGNSDPSYKEKVQAVLDKIQDPDTKTFFGYGVESGLRNHNKLMESKRTGDWSIYYGRLWHKPTTTTQEVAVRRRDSHVYDNFWYSTRLTDHHCWMRTTQLPAEVEEKLCKEALDAFEPIIKAAANNDERYWLTHITQSGRPLLLPKEQTEQNLKSYGTLYQPLISLGRLSVFKNFLASVPKPTQRSVFLFGFPEHEDRQTSRTLPPAALQEPQKYADVIVVRFRYEGMHDFVRKYPTIFGTLREDIQKGEKSKTPPPMLSEPKSITPDGDPVVTMIWEAGQWYWNPFGL